MTLASYTMSSTMKRLQALTLFLIFNIIIFFDVSREMNKHLRDEKDMFYQVCAIYYSRIHPLYYLNVPCSHPKIYTESCAAI